MKEIQSTPNSMPSYLVPAKSKDPKIIAWWFRLSCPVEPPPEAPLVQRERFRRARLASIIILLMQIFVITSLPAGFSGTNRFLAILMAFAFVANVLAMFFNRAGVVTVSGLLIILNVEASMCANIITSPGGLSLSVLPLFDLLVIPLVLAASLLPIGYVFLFAVLNSAFVILGTAFLPRSADFAEALKTAGFGLVSLPIFIQLILAVIAFLWVRSATQAISRADRAEQIALLEHDIAETHQQSAEQKTQLETALQEISSALTRAANGDNATRIPTQGNVLWLIAGPINTMLARMQRLRYTEMEHQQILQELEQFLFVLRSAREKQQPLRLPRGQGGARLGPLYDEVARLSMHDSSAKGLPYTSLPDQR